jgi:hypothetical protein
MDRPPRALRPAAVPLEGRILLAQMTVPTTTTTASIVPSGGGDSVYFLGGSASETAVQQVAQQVGAATVWLQRSESKDTAQVQVTTDPSSPAVGVNLPAVNQTVTFAPGQSIAALTVPLNANAANPGEVDVNLTATPISPSTNFTVDGPVELQILAPAATTPPRIIGVIGTSAGIELVFSKPMNPAQASNVHNYTVSEFYTKPSDNPFSAQSIFESILPIAPGDGKTLKLTKSVPLRSASYDPADFTVTLVPKRRLSPMVMRTIVVTQGTQAKTSAPHRHGSSSLAQGLTDLEGNAINQNGSPGKFRIPVNSGYTPLLVGGSSTTTV